MAKANVHVSRDGFTLEELPRLVPSIVAEKPYHEMTDRYAYLPSIVPITALYNEGMVCTKVIENRVRKEDKDGFQKHLLIFKPMGGGELLRGVQHNVAFINSHDGTAALKMISAGHIDACSNGVLFINDKQDEEKVRHSGNKTVDDVVDASYRIIERAPIVAETIRTMQSKQLTDKERIAFARAALELRWESAEIIEPNGDVILKATAPIQAEQLLKVKRNEDMGTDLFTTFNVIQEHIIRGGDSQYDMSKRRYVTTRAVNSATENVRLNKALWVLAKALEQ